MPFCLIKMMHGECSTRCVAALAVLPPSSQPCGHTATTSIPCACSLHVYGCQAAASLGFAARVLTRSNLRSCQVFL